MTSLDALVFSVDLLQRHGLQALGNDLTVVQEEILVDGELATYLPIRHEVFLDLVSVWPSLLAEGDELAADTVFLLSFTVLIKVVLASLQIECSGNIMSISYV